MAMKRSQKKALKKKVVKETIDEDKEFYLRYVGDLEISK